MSVRSERVQTQIVCVVKPTRDEAQNTTHTRDDQGDIWTAPPDRMLRCPPLQRAQRNTLMPLYPQRKALAAKEST